MDKLSQVLSKNFIDNVQSDAEIEIKKDRSKYNNVYNIIETYAQKNQLILSNMALIVDKKQPLARKEYHIYDTNPLRHANNLANEINKIDKWVRMKTMESHKKFAIEYDTRNICYVYKLNKPQNVDIKQIIKPVILKSIKYLPPEIEIIDYYHLRYSPEGLEDWDDDLEEKLYNAINARIKNGIIGAGCLDRKQNEVEALKQVFVNDFLPGNNDIILIGHWADALKENKISTERVQFICDQPIKSIITQLSSYFATYTKFGITYRTYDLNLPKDARVTRYTFYVKMPVAGGVKDQAFLEMYNASSFELIPYYLHKRVQVASKYVLLRFLFIDLWIIRLIVASNVINISYCRKKITKIWNLIKKIRLKCDPNLEYLGVNYPSMIADKLNYSNTKMHYPYYPEITKRTTGNYRII